MSPAREAPASSRSTSGTGSVKAWAAGLSGCDAQPFDMDGTSRREPGAVRSHPRRHRAHSEKRCAGEGSDGSPNSASSRLKAGAVPSARTGTA
ncbi:hypothetical protein NWFMUON74_34120 [Nocardia wallacei]|uniref:Uncharacterized protein n=1 Tax=Nocardia wallacei TaxID=480035 RepID=A0A7G1KKT5_9NOCA|nr:hypothetical protein NWFMUON74_34120 [Nocardia wallacei]